jgi:hypothetical protein
MQGIATWPEKGMQGITTWPEKGYAHGQKSYAEHRKMARKAMQSIRKWPEKLCKA